MPKLTPPGVILIDPKYAHNVGGVVRACSCFGIDTLVWSGVRILDQIRERLPREERLRDYKSVTFVNNEAPLKAFGACTPIAVEVRQHSESLIDFIHPEDAVYIFGPEDGSIPTGLLHACHRFVMIPSHHALNLAAAVNVVLYDRRLKRQLDGRELRVPANALLRQRVRKTCDY